LFVDAVPIRADGRVAGRWCRRAHLRFGQDARHETSSIENHSIYLRADIGDLRLEEVDFTFLVEEFVDCVDLAGEVTGRIDLGGEICDRRVDARPPRRNLLRRVLEGL
jgi:hypothetical protein